MARYQQQIDNSAKAPPRFFRLRPPSAVEAWGGAAAVRVHPSVWPAVKPTFMDRPKLKRVRLPRRYAVRLALPSPQQALVAAQAGAGSGFYTAERCSCPLAGVR